MRNNIYSRRVKKEVIILKKDFKIAMKKARKDKKITQTDLAKSIGRSPQLICDIEAGRKKPGRQAMIEIAKKLEISLDDIFLN